MNLFDLGAPAGTGARLVARSLDKVERHGAELTIVVGDPRDAGAVARGALSPRRGRAREASRRDRRSMPMTKLWTVAVVMVGLASVFAATSCKAPPGDAAKGQELFVNACARCHGANGGGGLALWEGGPAPRDFRARAFQDAITDEQIKLTIVNGKGAGMPPFGKTFKDAELAALVAQVRSFDEGKKK